MALVVKDRVREITTTAGTGPVTLGGAVLGFQTFAVIGNGNTTYYAIVDSTTGAWEVGIGTYTASGTTLSRDTVLESSNSGNLVPFSSNVKDVFVTYPAERSIYTDAAGTAITPATSSILGVASGGTGLSTLTTNRIPYGNGASAFQSSASLTFDGTTLSTTTVDATNLEVTNIKAKDGTAAGSIADSTGLVTLTNLTGTTADYTNLEVTNLKAKDGTAAGSIADSTGLVTLTNLTGTTADYTNLEVTNIKAKDGTAAASIADSTGNITVSTELSVDNLNLNGNTVSTTNTNGNMTFTANGTGYYVYSGTQAILVPKGNNTTERPGTPVTGMLRYNTTTEEFEGYSGSSAAWKSVGGAAISNDTSTATDVYPAFLAATSGTASTVYTSNAKLLYKPSTGELKASAPVASNGIFVNNTTVAANYTIDTGTNGMSVGPITVNNGVSVTVSSGQRWLVL